MTNKRSLGDEALDALDSITKGERVLYRRSLECSFVAPRDGVVVGFHIRSDRAWPLVYQDDPREVPGAAFNRFNAHQKVKAGDKLDVLLDLGLSGLWEE